MSTRPGATPTPIGFSLLRDSLLFGRPWITFEADDDDTPGATPGGNDTTPADDAGNDLDGLTPEQLRAKLRETRDALASVNQESAARRHKIREYETAAEQRQREADEAEQARLKEQGKHEEAATKAEKRAQELQDKLDALEAERANDRKRAALETAARAANFANPADALAFVPLDSVELDDSGNVTNAKTLVEAVAKERAYLLATRDPIPGNGRGPKRTGAATHEREVTPIVDVKSLF